MIAVFAIPIPIVVAISTVTAIAAIIIIPIAPFALAPIDNFKVSSAPLIDPDAIPLVAPGTTEDAVGFAALPDDKDAVARIDQTTVAPHVIRCAVDQRGRPVRPVTRDEKVRAAATVHPNSP